MSPDLLSGRDVPADPARANGGEATVLGGKATGRPAGMAGQEHPVGPSAPQPSGAGLRGLPGSARRRTGRRAPGVRFADTAERGARR